MKSINTLMDRHANAGTLRWIGLRPGKREPLRLVETAQLNTSDGLVGDRYAGRSGKRQVTLIQQEHLAAIAGIMGQAEIDPALLRRNLVVSGINLLALKQRRFRIGEAVLEVTGLCHPCSHMETALGTGGYNAMRGHGGLTARVLCPGTITVGDEVLMVSDEETAG